MSIIYEFVCIYLLPSHIESDRKITSWRIFDEKEYDWARDAAHKQWISFKALGKVKE